jgi:3-oxoadipate enol-lactonase
MADVDIGGETFRIEFEGEKSLPVLMLSNALGTNLHMWDAQVPAFLEHYRVLRYDARGHGGSLVSDGPYTIDGLGKDALKILDYLDLGTVDFLGISLGGFIGQWLLSFAPSRIRKAVLVSTASQLGSEDMWNNRIQTVLQDGMSAVAPGLIEQWFTREFRERHPKEVAKIEEMILNTAPKGYAATCEALRDADLREVIGSIRAPVLVMVARHDAVTPAGIGALITNAIPGAKLATLDAAHLSNIGDAANFTDKALEFLLTGPRSTEEAVSPSEKEQTVSPAADEAASSLDQDLQQDLHQDLPPADDEPSPALEGTEAVPDEPPAKPKAPRKPRQKKPAVAEGDDLIHAIEPPIPTPEAADESAAEEAESPEPAAPKPSKPRKASAKKAPLSPAPTEPETAPVEELVAVEEALAEEKPVRKTRQKAPVKKLPAAPARRAPVKKAAAQKTPQKKAVVKKAGAKKATVQKAAVKKTTLKKAPVKKTAVKATPKKAASKKAVAQKATVKKLAPSRAAPKKTVAQKTVAQKTASKKLAVKKTAIKKTAAKKTAVKKTALKKSVAKKAVATKAQVKKTVGKKAPAKKTAAQKALSKAVLSRKTGPARGARKAAKKAGRRR